MRIQISLGLRLLSKSLLGFVLTHTRYFSFFFFFWKEVLEMSSPRLNEQLYTLLMVVDQNHHGNRKAAGHVDIQANCFLCHSFPSPQLSVSFHPPKHSNGRKRRQKSKFFPVRQWIGCPWRGGLWEGRAPRLWCCVAVGIFQMLCPQDRWHY